VYEAVEASSFFWGGGLLGDRPPRNATGAILINQRSGRTFLIYESLLVKKSECEM